MVLPGMPFTTGELYVYGTAVPLAKPGRSRRRHQRTI